MVNVEQALEEIKPFLENKFPRNIVSICEKLNIQVKQTNEFPKDVSGVIYKENNNYFILINSTHSVGRKSFTIAHELGHYFLHKEKLDRDSEIVSGSKGVEYIPRQNITSSSSDEYRQMETEANDFAANILMPAEEFIEQCKELNSIDDVANYFGVSISAATMRANKLGGLYFL